MLTGILGSGRKKPEYQLLEEEFAKYVGSKYAVAVNSGTSALTLAVAALGIGLGDEVIVPEFTMIASAWAVTYNRATPVFVDCSDDQWNIDPTKIEAAITPATKAIMVVHIYGVPCDMEAIMKIAKKHKLLVIEDCAEAIGATVGKKMVGTFGKAGCFSFYKNKAISSGEGGMVVTDDKKLYDAMQDMKSMSFGKEHDYLHKRIGFNFRMADNLASLARLDLGAIEAINSMRFEKLWEMQEKMFGEVIWHPPEGSVVWVFPMLFDKKSTRDYFLKKMPDARYFFKPMSQQPMYLSKKYEKLNAFDFSQRGAYLPVKVVDETH